MSSTKPAPPIRTVLMLVAFGATILAVVASADRWDDGCAATPLRSAALFLWMVYVIAHYGEKHLAGLRDLRDEVATYGQTRYGEGVEDSLARQRQPAAQNLHSLR